MALPTCECVAELPLGGKVAAVYGVLRQLAGSLDSLPTYECVQELPLGEIVDKIYCAARAWAASL